MNLSFTSCILCLVTFVGERSFAAPSVEQLEASVRQNYVSMVYAAYSDAQCAAKKLCDEITTFVVAPSEKGLNTCRATWIKARQPYLKTECFRFYGGPIDNASGGLEGQLNAWPVDESWLEDPTEGSTRGIIQDVARHPKIDAKLLARLNQFEGEKNISTGWHAIEFLLWGVDNNPDGPGDRPWTDFSKGDLAGRRRDALLGCATNVLACMDRLVEAWDPSSTSGSNYRASFMAGNTHQMVTRIFIGVTLLVGAEMAGERMTVGLETHDQENEQSCFSDTTKQDFIYNLAGVKMVWEGKFESQFLADIDVSGTGLRDVAKAWDPSLTAVIDTAIAKSDALCKALPERFDQALDADDTEPSRIAVVKTRDSLEYINALLQALAGRIAIVLPTTPLDG